MRISGLNIFANDKVMGEYVKFICAQVGTECGASVSTADGFPMKGHYVPVKIEFTHIGPRSAEAKIEVFGFVKEFTVFMSRHKSPNEMLHKIQDKVDEATLEIIKENNLDKTKIWQDHHPLKNLRFSKK